MKKLYIPLIILTGLGLNAFAQEKSAKELKGDKYAFRYAYEDAIGSYTSAKQLTPEGQRRLAESYHNINRNKESEIVYAGLSNNSSGTLAEDHFNYAMILKMNGKYEEANKAMDKFSAMKPDDLRAKSYVENKEGFSGLLKDDGKYKVEHLKVNTEAKDFAPTYYKDKIVFASTRSAAKMVKRKDNWTGMPFLNLYVSDIDGSQLKKPENFNKDMNTKMHDGPASFSNNGTFMAFTTNNSDDKTPDKIVELQIAFSTFKDENWSEPEAFAFNNPEYSVGHPCLTSDGNTMYFTSDMPGGYGGSDIYKSSRTGTTWSKPENLGANVNTEGDEMFPFLVESKGTIFFSSNGHFGLGGQDNFYCIPSGKSYAKAVNCGSPLNTQYDDFAVIADGTTNKGYFSSNRAEGNGDDDIYTVDFLKGINTGKQINGFARDNDGNVIPKTFITLSNDKGVMIDTLTTDDKGEFTFAVDADKNFKLNGKKEKYTDGDSTANTFGKDAVVKADVILLTRKEAIAKKIEVGKDLGKVVSFNPIYFDYHEYAIRPDAEIELKKIISAMNDYPNMTIELGAHTDCRATQEFNQLLSERRAKASIDYIKKGISNPSRITGKGYGETRLANQCACEGENVKEYTEEEHQMNRRTEFIVIKK
ncbi:MAG TPA: OmpA family protein [Bacteroidia bacterium]|jgi:outer membrane protein OmpA-like peptidoglycan-associated protein